MLAGIRSRFRNDPLIGNVLGVIALFIALGGVGWAAANIDSGDVKDNSLKSVDLKDGKAVRSSDIADGSVADADLSPVDPVHVVGTAGEPAFGDGAEGDCLYSNVTVSPPTTLTPNPVSFFKDHSGIVHLIGWVSKHDGPGGDADCTIGTSEEGDEDSIVFQLPSGYQPANFEIHNTTDSFDTSVAIGPDHDAITGSGATLPAGSVLITGAPSGGPGGIYILDGITFRASGVGDSSAAGSGPRTRVGNLPGLLAD